MESALLESGDLKGLSVLSMHEQRLIRAFDKTLAILGKLHATSRTQAAAIAVAQGHLEERMPIPAAARSARLPRVEAMTQLV